jgi:hypothetical protein
MVARRPIGSGRPADPKVVVAAEFAGMTRRSDAGRHLTGFPESGIGPV